MNSNELSFKEKKEYLIDSMSTLLPEINLLSDEEILRIINLYENDNDIGTCINNKNLIVLYSIIYELIKDKQDYYDLMVKLENVYEEEISKCLKKTIYEHGIPTDRVVRVSYTWLSYESILLASMCLRQMEEWLIQYKNGNIKDFPRHSLDLYGEIRSDFNKNSNILFEEKINKRKIRK